MSDIMTTTLNSQIRLGDLEGSTVIEHARGMGPKDKSNEFNFVSQYV